MKILCDKAEFALLVRECQRCEAMEDCHGCLFVGLCSAAGEDTPSIMTGIEDICEIVTEG